MPSEGSCLLCACRHRPVPPLPCRCSLCPCPGLAPQKGVKSRTQWVVLRTAGFQPQSLAAWSPSSPLRLTCRCVGAIWKVLLVWRMWDIWTGRARQAPQMPRGEPGKFFTFLCRKGHGVRRSFSLGMWQSLSVRVCLVLEIHTPAPPRLHTHA